MDRKQIASIQESIGETSSQSVVVAVDRYWRSPCCSDRKLIFFKCINSSLIKVEAQPVSYHAFLFLGLMLSRIKSFHWSSCKQWRYIVNNERTERVF